MAKILESSLQASLRALYSSFERILGGLTSYLGWVTVRAGLFLMMACD